MSRRFKALFLAGVILADISVMTHFNIFGIVPNYMFIAILAVTVISPGAESTVISALAGLSVDLLSGCMTGLNTLLCMYFTIVCALFVNLLYIKKLKVILPMCFILSVLYEFLFGLFSTLLRGGGFYAGLLLTKVIPTAAVNTVIFLPVYLILSRLKYEKKVKGIKYEK